LILLTPESRCTRRDNIPWITLWTDPIVDIEVEVPGLRVDGPEETLELCKDGIGSEHIEAEDETDGMGPVHLVGMGEVEWGSNCSRLWHVAQ